MARILVLPVCATVAVIACGPGEGTPPTPPSPVASVTFPIDSLGSVPGGVLHLRVVLRDSANAPLTGEPVHWTSLDTAVAAVDSTGAVTAKSVGLARVIAASGAHADTIRLRFNTLLFTGIWVGDFHACGITSPSGSVYCWGFGGNGELGIGDTMTTDVPVRVLSTQSFATLGAGYRHTCGLTITATVFCWGLNEIGELGIGARDTEPHVVPEMIAGGGYTALSVGDFHNCVITSGGTASCWGYGSYGQLGTGDTTAIVPAAVPVAGGLHFRTISAGGVHTCGITVDSIGYCWGPDEQRTGTTCSTPGCLASPQPISGGLKMIAISAAEVHTCAIAVDNKAWCWGLNDNLQLGVSRDTLGSATPVPVHGSHLFAQLAAGSYHVCAVTPADAAYCWGAGLGGQLGDGSNVDSSEPLAVAGNLQFAEISAATNYSCGVSRNGVGYCWGSDQSYVGVLGTGDAAHVFAHATPTKVLGQP